MYQQVLVYDKYPTIFGYGRYTIKTTSNTATYHLNDYVITHKQPQYSVGEVVLYMTSEGTVVIDTIQKINLEQFKLANSGYDYIDIDDIQGKVIEIIPNVGSFFSVLESPTGTILLFILIVLMLEAPKLKETIKPKK